MANLGFEYQHLDRIDGLELIEKKMWEEYNKEKDPFKRVQILKDIAEIQPYLSSIYDATKYVINNKNKTDSEDQQETERLKIGEEIYKKEKERAIFHL